MEFLHPFFALRNNPNETGSKNKSKNTITTFCLRMKVNKKNYQLCYGEKKKISINVIRKIYGD